MKLGKRNVKKEDLESCIFSRSEQFATKVGTKLQDFEH